MSLASFIYLAFYLFCNGHKPSPFPFLYIFFCMFRLGQVEDGLKKNPKTGGFEFRSRRTEPENLDPNPSLLYLSLLLVYVLMSLA